MTIFFRVIGYLLVIAGVAVLINATIEHDFKDARWQSLACMLPGFWIIRATGKKI